MSRIGRQPIPLPESVSVSLSPGRVQVNGPLGELVSAVPQRMKIEQRDDLFDGIVTLTADGARLSDGDWNALYRPNPPTEKPTTLTALPYYLWNNRGPGTMMVWLAET